MPAYALNMETQLETDLPSLANQAAIELDKLVLGRTGGLEAVHRLAEKLSRTVTDVPNPGSPSSLLNVRTAVLVHRAIGDVGTGTASVTLDELVTKAKELTAKLQGIDQNTIADGEQELELKKLRTFCVSLSRHALAREAGPDDRPQHPFRR